jgi:hypothetical protein
MKSFVHTQLPSCLAYGLALIQGLRLQQPLVAMTQSRQPNARQCVESRVAARYL